MATLEVRFLSFATRRYLGTLAGSADGSKFLRFVTVVAITGIAVGVAALLLALAIVRGFSHEIESKIVGFGAHIQIENIQDSPVANASEIVSTIQNEFAEVVLVQSYVEEFGLLRASSRSIEGIRLAGSDNLPPFIQENLIDGAGDLTAEDGSNRIVVGRTLAEELGLVVGKKVAVFSLQGRSASSLTSPRVRQFVVSGIFETSLADYDEIVAFTDIGVARQLFDYGREEVSRIDVSLMDTEDVTEVAGRIEETIGFPYMARTIYDVFQSIFAWVRLQESIIPIVISVIILVAAFNVVGTMLMILLEKTNDVGVLMSIGASPKTVRRLFVLIGFGLGAVGTVIGSGLALCLALIQQRFGIIPLPAESYYMDTAPIELALMDFVLVGLITLLLCMLAAYIPARVASKIQPVSVIRFH